MFGRAPAPWLHALSLLAVLAPSLGCDGEPDLDAGVDGGAARCDAPPSLDTGDPDGHPAPLAASAGEARAGRLGADDLPPAPGEALPWREGDFVLANDRVAIVIEDAGVSDGFDPHGGMPVGVAVVEGGALVDPMDWGELFFTFGAAGLETESVSVMADGSDGGEAVVRARGRAVTLGFLDFLAGIVDTDVPDVEIAIDYALAPDADTVEVRVVGANAQPSSTLVRQPLLFAMQQNRTPKYGQGFGFDVPSGEPVDHVVFADDDATSYGFESGRAPLRVYIEQSNLLGMLLPRYAFDACAETEIALGRFAIGRDGLDGVLPLLEPERVEVTGTVTTSDGDPASGARVHATLADGTYAGRATAGADGAFALHLPPGAVTLRPFRQDDAVGAELEVTAPADGVALILGPTGAVRVDVTDAASGEPIPARIQALPLDGEAFRAPSAWGERPIVRGRSAVRYSVGGTELIRLPVGRHRLVASRGPQWELDSVEVDVADGATTDVALSLEHVVQTPGVMCGDFHVHTHRSFDAEDDAALKVHAAAAEGLEIPVRSDHEWVADFEPVIAAEGLEEVLYGMGSLELTTFVYGHFGVFPLDPDPDARNGGAVPWVGRSPSEVFTDAESRVGRFGPAALMINHPREGLALLGYFVAAGYDPVTGTAAAPDLWWDEFRLHEVFNDSDYDANEANVADWYSFLARGRRVVAMGNSDSHEVAGSPIGYPRTCIALGLDSPTELRAGGGAALVRDRLLDGAAAVCGGVTVEAAARGGVGLGGTLEAAMERESVEVTVRAPSWVTVDRLRVFVNGALSETIALDDSTADPLDPTIRFRGPVEIATSVGETFLVLVADGEGDLAPVYPGRDPFGVTNPVWFRR